MTELEDRGARTDHDGGPGPGASASVWRTIRRSGTESRFLAVLALLIVMIIAFSLTQSSFMTSANIKTLLTGVSDLWVVSMGLTFVMLTGGFDLSVGALPTFCGFAFAGYYTHFGLPGGIALVLTLATGLLLGGAINGLFIGWVGLSFLVVTLGTLSLFQGLVQIVSGTATITINSKMLDAIGFNSLAGIPITIWIMFLTYVVTLYVLRRTYFGRDVYAVGGNPAAARLSGIAVGATVVAVYALAGLGSALGGVLEASQIGAASPIAGTEIVFTATAAVLLGGARLGGGVGGATGTAIGVLFLGVLQNGLSLAGLASFWQQVVTGVILVLVVLFDRIQRKSTVGFGYGRE